MLGEQNFKDILNNVGLTEKEIQIYIFLAKFGALKTGEISKQTKINKGEVYRILKTLAEKGVVESTLDLPALYSAVGFDKILDSAIRAKREEATNIEKAKDELLNYWRGIQRVKNQLTTQKLTVIKGNRKIYLKISQLMRETKNQFHVMLSIQDLLRANQSGIFDMDYKQPFNDVAKFKFLTDLPAQNVKAVKNLLSDFEKSGLNFEGRTPNLGLRLFPRLVIKDQKEALFFIDKDPSSLQDETCIETNSKSLIDAFTVIFNDSWKNSSSIRRKIAEIESGNISSKSQETIGEPCVLEKFESLINTANKEITILTSSSGLTDIWNTKDLIKTLHEKNVAIKLMAPITTANSKISEQLSQFSEVKHIPYADMVTVLVDGKHVFQSKELQPNKKSAQEHTSMAYSEKPSYVRKISVMLNNIWLTATPPSPQPLRAVILPQLTEAPREAVERFAEKLKSSPPNDLPVAHCTCGIAYIHPPSNVNIPTIFLHIFHYADESAFGGGDVIVIRLPLKVKGSKNYSYVPVAIANTNPKAVIPEKALYSGSPAADNYLLVKPEELRVQEQGNVLFGGWTFPMPLPPTRHSLPPGVLLIEGYGNIRHLTSIFSVPIGNKVFWEFDAQDAFVTFLDPSWKYGGPGTQGKLYKNLTSYVLPAAYTSTNRRLP